MFVSPGCKSHSISMKTTKDILSKRKRTWTPFRVEIRKLVEKLHLSEDDFSEVPLNQWKEVKSKIWAKFSSNNNSKWIWETLSEPYASFPLNDEWLQIEELIDSSEKLWFLFNEPLHEKTKFWVYEGITRAFEKIISASGYVDEILIVSKKYEWILIINHHNILIGTGKMKERIEKRKKK